jgi:beta-phosphoglucomutase-like phosphatase (HAD superfamily)
VLERAGIVSLFDVIFDGRDLEAENLPGKPRPDAFLRVAARLGVGPEQTTLIEDAVSGIAAGRAGNFGLVVGVDRGAGRDALRKAGADVVVADLAELDAVRPAGRGKG